MIPQTYFTKKWRQNTRNITPSYGVKCLLNRLGTAHECDRRTDRQNWLQLKRRLTLLDAYVHAFSGMCCVLSSRHLAVVSPISDR